MTKARVVVCGGLNYDFVVPVPQLPAKGETVMGGDLMQATGGKGANQALQAARLGANVVILGCVGQDFMGEAQLESLGGDGVDTRYVRSIPGVSTGVALITVGADGDNTIAVSIGANARCDHDYVSDCAEAFSGGILLTQCELAQSALLRALGMAKAAGMYVILDPAPAVELPEEIWPLCDLVKPNETEAAFHTGIQPGKCLRTWGEEAARALIKKGAGAALITFGGEGSLYVDKNEVIFTPAFAVNAVDATAAGDSFAGALATALGEGMPKAEALRFAAAAGAISASRAGAQPSLPSRAQVDAFMRERE